MPQARQLALMLSVGAAVIVASESQAIAGGFEVPENTALGVARAGTGAASRTDPAAAYFNPALLTGAKGLQFITDVNVVNLNLSFEAVEGDALMNSLKDIAVSSGSACTTADPEPSHVLRAIGRNDALTRASLRFGLGRFNTAEEVDFAAETVANVVQRLRRLSRNESC